MPQQYDRHHYIDPRGNRVLIGDLVAVTPYGTGNPEEGSFRFGVVEKFKHIGPRWNMHDRSVFIRHMTLNTNNQTIGSTNGSWICQHNQRVFKLTGDSVDILSATVVQLTKMMKGRDDEQNRESSRRERVERRLDGVQ